MDDTQINNYVQNKALDTRNTPRYYNTGFPELCMKGYGTSLGNTDTNQINTARAFAPTLPGTGAQNTWALARTGTGTYTLAHNLGSIEVYLVLAYAAGAISQLRVTAQTANVITFTSYNQAGAATDGPFTYLVYGQP